MPRCSPAAISIVASLVATPVLYSRSPPQLAQTLLSTRCAACKLSNRAFGWRCWIGAVPGRPVVLLAGGGNTAHVFDEFAPKLATDHHVYSRRAARVRRLGLLDLGEPS